MDSLIASGLAQLCSTGDIGAVLGCGCRGWGMAAVTTPLVAIGVAVAIAVGAGDGVVSSMSSSIDVGVESDWVGCEAVAGSSLVEV